MHGRKESEGSSEQHCEERSTKKRSCIRAETEESECDRGREGWEDGRRKTGSDGEARAVGLFTLWPNRV